MSPREPAGSPSGGALVVFPGGSKTGAAAIAGPKLGGPSGALQAHRGPGPTPTPRLPEHPLSASLKSTARKNPTVSKLLDNWDEFEGSLRREATSRWKSLTYLAPPPNGMPAGSPPGAPGGQAAATPPPRMRRVQSAQEVRTLTSMPSSPDDEEPTKKRRLRRKRRQKSGGDAGLGGIPEAQTTHAASAAASAASANSSSGSPQSQFLTTAMSSLNLLPAGRPLFPVASAPSMNFSLNQQKDSELSELPADLGALAGQLTSRAAGAIEHASATLQSTAHNCQDNLRKLSTLVEALPASGASALSDLSRRLVDPSASASASPTGDRGSPLPPASEKLTESASASSAEQARLAIALTPHDEALNESASLNSEMSASAEPAVLAELPAEKKKGWGWRLGGKAREDKPYRSLREEGRSIAIVTTAGLPWMTGTAINPLLRAAYLARGGQRNVRLLIPWLSEPDQRKVFPGNMTFDTPEAQEKHIRDWLHQRVGFKPDFKVAWYPGRYASEKGSIMPVGDPTKYIPDAEADIAVLEEPEHLNWYHHGQRWTDKFAHVVGVMHTNYIDYVMREDHGELKAMLTKRINQWVCRSHCHKVIKLSDAVQDLPRQETMFVHGVSPSFLEVGARKAEAATLALESAAATAAKDGQSANNARRASTNAPATSNGASAAAAPADNTAASSSSSSSSNKDGKGGSVWTKGAYFLGKAVWAKGYTELLDLMESHCARAANGDAGATASTSSPKEAADSGNGNGNGRRGGLLRRRGSATKGNDLEDATTAHKPAHAVDVYGSGPDLGEIQTGSTEKALPLQFHGAIDHAHPSLQDYKVFINPSLSDVVATTTAEALAMGKFVIVHEHPCNEFFSSFENCLIYRNPEEFSEKLSYALKHDPRPMSASERHRLTWDAATERFLDVAELRADEDRPPLPKKVVDDVLWSLHNGLVGNEGFRLFAGAGPGTRDNPSEVTAYVATDYAGSFFDNKARANKVNAKAHGESSAARPAHTRPQPVTEVAKGGDAQ